MMTDLEWREANDGLRCMSWAVFSGGVNVWLLRQNAMDARSFDEVVWCGMEWNVNECLRAGMPLFKLNGVFISGKKAYATGRFAGW